MVQPVQALHHTCPTGPSGHTENASIKLIFQATGWVTRLERCLHQVSQRFLYNTAGAIHVRTPWVFSAEARRALLYGLLILLAALTPPLIMLVNRFM